MAITPSLESRSEYGTVKVLFWGKDGIGIRSIQPLVVNRVETVVDAHLLEYDDGYDFKNLSVRRHDNFQPVSQSARNKVRDMVLVLTKALLQAKPELFREGEIVRLTNELTRNQQNQITLQRRLNRLKAEEGDLQRAFDTIQQLPAFTTDMQECDGCGRNLSLMEYEAGDGLCEVCVSKTY
ncbi:hypothetical protein KA005_82610 [bacterium]|nr:hypothetical protein [bacterium]